jgi:hypothetical protein
MREVLLFFLPRYGVVSRRAFTLALLIAGSLFVSGGWMSYYASAHRQKLPAFIYIGNTHYGGQSPAAVYEQLSSQVASLKITLRTSNGATSITETYSGTDLGVTIDLIKIQALTYDIKNTIPKPKLFSEHIQIPINIDTEQLQKTANELMKSHNFPTPIDGGFVYADGLTTIPAVNGLSLNTDAIKLALISKLHESLQDIEISVPPQTQKPDMTDGDISSLRQSMLKKINRTHTIRAKNQVITLTPGQLLRIFQIKKTGRPIITVSKQEVDKLVKELAKTQYRQPVSQTTTKYRSGKDSSITSKGISGYSVKNTADLAGSLTRALQNDTSYRGSFIYKDIPFTDKVVTIDDRIHRRIVKYNVTTWGTVQADSETFKKLVAQTLQDSRGWRSANITFNYVTSGEDLTVVLSEPARVASASPICDSFYSCRVGRFAIINDDRWRLATSVWSGSLRDYQHMVLNHEVGHWLGRGHAFCGGRGQLAPVMQQQSMGLQGCKTNPWPLGFEIQAVK